jgi:hypothetical protein
MNSLFLHLEDLAVALWNWHFGFVAYRHYNLRLESKCGSEAWSSGTPVTWIMLPV